MSWLSKFVLHPLSKIVKVDLTVTPNFPLPAGVPAPSSVGAASQVLYDAEALIKEAVEHLLVKTLGSDGSKVAQPLADAVLALAEQHIVAYVTALFTHAKSQPAA